MPSTIRRPIAASVFRWVLAVVAGALIALVIAYHKHIWQALAPLMAGAAALVWGVLQKLWAKRDQWIAYWTTPPKTVAPGKWPPSPLARTPARSQFPPTRKDEPMDLKTFTDAARNALVNSGVASDVLKAFDDAIDAAQPQVTAEADRLLNTLPPAWAPLAPSLAALVQQGAAQIREKAEAEAAKLEAALPVLQAA